MVELYRMGALLGLTSPVQRISFSRAALTIGFDYLCLLLPSVAVVETQPLQASLEAMSCHRFRCSLGRERKENRRIEVYY